jgi:hypothetical protein
MTPTFIPLWFNCQNSFYYIRSISGHNTVEDRPKVLFSPQDVDLYNWLVANVGPSEGPLDNLPIKGEGWELIGPRDVSYPYEDSSRKSGVYIDDELLAVQLKCSGILDDRPVDPILKMVEEMQRTMLNAKTPFLTVDSLSQLAPISHKSKYNYEDHYYNFPKFK